MDAAETAKKILELYDGKPERWTRGAFARLATDVQTSAHNESATCWCLAGAEIAIQSKDQADYDSFFNAMAAITGMGMVEWNDRPERTFAEVEALLKEIAGCS